MISVIDSRLQILERIRAATRNSATTVNQAAGKYAALDRGYVRHGGMTFRACREQFVERLREYEAEVVECRPEELVEAIRSQLESTGAHRLLAPDGLPVVWLANGFEWMIDRELPAQDVARADGVLTTCFCGVAESGTIVLHHSKAEGRRILTLLPDWHLCILYASQVVETLSEYVSLCEQPPALATYISGPSATADIEMTRIKGVHGPRSLTTIIVLDR